MPVIARAPQIAGPRARQAETLGRGITEFGKNIGTMYQKYSSMMSEKEYKQNIYDEAVVKFKNDPILMKSLEKAKDKMIGMDMKEFELSMHNFTGAADHYQSLQKMDPDTKFNSPYFNRFFSADKANKGNNEIKTATDKRRFKEGLLGPGAPQPEAQPSAAPAPETIAPGQVGIEPSPDTGAGAPTIATSPVTQELNQQFLEEGAPEAAGLVSAAGLIQEPGVAGAQTGAQVKGQVQSLTANMEPEDALTYVKQLGAKFDQLKNPLYQETIKDLNKKVKDKRLGKAAADIKASDTVQSFLSKTGLDTNTETLEVAKLLRKQVLRPPAPPKPPPDQFRQQRDFSAKQFAQTKNFFNSYKSTVDKLGSDSPEAKTAFSDYINSKGEYLQNKLATDYMQRNRVADIRTALNATAPLFEREKAFIFAEGKSNEIASILTTEYNDKLSKLEEKKATDWIPGFLQGGQDVSQEEMTALSETVFGTADAKLTGANIPGGVIEQRAPGEFSVKDPDTWKTNFMNQRFGRRAPESPGPKPAPGGGAQLANDVQTQISDSLKVLDAPGNQGKLTSKMREIVRRMKTDETLSPQQKLTALKNIITKAKLRV